MPRPHPYRQHPSATNTCQICGGPIEQHARAEGSHDRERRFARRFVFVLLCIDGLLLGLTGSLALAVGTTGPFAAWSVVNAVVSVVALLIAASGKIFK